LKRSWIVLVVWIIAGAEQLVQAANCLYNLWYLLTALIVFCFVWAWTSIRWSMCSATLIRNRSQVGKMAEEHLRGPRTGACSPSCGWKYEIVRLCPSTLPAKWSTRLDSRQARTWSVKTRCRQRGRFLLGPVSLTSGDPFGLFTMQRQLNQLRKTSFIVYPANRRPAVLCAHGGTIFWRSTLRRRTPLCHHQCFGVREYAPGDSFNRIHWPSSARTGRLISKEFELDPTADVWLFLDLERAAQVELVSPSLKAVPRCYCPGSDRPNLGWRRLRWSTR